MDAAPCGLELICIWDIADSCKIADAEKIETIF
jgi:hypothetical protein